MEFFRHKARILIGLLCLAALAGVLWFCLFYQEQPKNPEGVLVYGNCRVMDKEAAV